MPIQKASWLNLLTRWSKELLPNICLVMGFQLSGRFKLKYKYTYSSLAKTKFTELKHYV